MIIRSKNQGRRGEKANFASLGSTWQMEIKDVDFATEKMRNPCLFV